MKNLFDRNIESDNVKGNYNILSNKIDVWNYVVDEIKDLFKSADYLKLTLPLGESSLVFDNKTLDALNIKDKNSLHILQKSEFVMMPPGPISIFNLIKSNNLLENDIVNVYSYGLAFVDHDNDVQTDPKQMHIFKSEIVGEKSSLRDAESILMAYRILEDIGVKNIMVNVNCLGDDSVRKNYYDELYSKLNKRFERLCKNNIENPINLYKEALKQNTEMNIPLTGIVDYLDKDNSVYFKEVLDFLDSLDIPYVLNPEMSGSIGFKDNTYFEIYSQDNPEKILVRGGNHDNILKLVGIDKKLGAVGFEMYVDNLMEIIFEEKKDMLEKDKPQVFIASIGYDGQKSSLKILSLMQKSGLVVKEHLGIKSLQKQLSKSKKLGATVTVIIGRKEAITNTAIIKDQFSDNQEVVPIDKLLSTIERKLVFEDNTKSKSKK